MESLTQEFDYYKTHQDELVKKYSGKFIVIKDKVVIGVYDSEEEAITTSLEQNELGSFLVQYVHGGKENITQTFHSRVMLNGR